MFVIKYKRTKLIALVICLPLLMGAAWTHCDGKPHPTGGQPDPAPNPDTGPGGPKTQVPKPIPADPEPQEEHVYSVFASWTPAAMAVWLDWQIGSHDTLNGDPFQRSGGSFSQTKTVRHHRSNPPEVFIEVRFIKGKGPGRVTCLALKDGNKGPNSEHSLQIIEPATGNARGVHCSI